MVLLVMAFHVLISMSVIRFLMTATWRSLTVPTHLVRSSVNALMASIRSTTLHVKILMSAARLLTFVLLTWIVKTLMVVMSALVKLERHLISVVRTKDQLTHGALVRLSHTFETLGFNRSIIPKLMIWAIFSYRRWLREVNLSISFFCAVLDRKVT